MAMKSRHAFGSKANVVNALEQGLIDAFDILFLNGENETPSIGWIDKDGNPVYIPLPENTDDLKALIEELESHMATKEQMTSIESQVADIENSLDDYLVKKYEISYKPDGTLVNYRDKEIRVMCPVDTKWVKQNVGANGNANMYYMGFKAYAPENAVSFKEDDKDVIEDQTMYYFENNDFAGIDADGRKYSIVWLALASYNEDTDTWSYFGAKSTTSKYIGWYYSVEWYDANGVLIASDCIRINLTNETCHSAIKPFYVCEEAEAVDLKIEQATSDATKAANSYTDSQIAEAFAIVEF